MLRLIVFTGLIAGLASAAWLAGSASLTPDRAAPSAAYRRAFIDPVTGALGPPTAAQRAAMQPAPPARRILQQSGDRSATPKITRRDGMTIVTVPRARWPGMRVKIGPDGEIVAAPGANHD